jgi:hypothetical protein
MEVPTINFNGSHSCNSTYLETSHTEFYTKFVVQLGLEGHLTLMFSSSYQPQQKGSYFG